MMGHRRKGDAMTDLRLWANSGWRGFRLEMYLSYNLKFQVSVSKDGDTQYAH